jgi:hypothetical protein
MSVIQDILKEELERLENLLQKYENEIKNLPKGSLSKKMRNDKAYLYLAYRENNKVRFKYLGKESSEAAQKAIEQRRQRLKYMSLLKKLKDDIKDIKRALNGLK